MYNPIINNNDDDIFDDSKSLSDLSGSKETSVNREKVYKKVDDVKLNELGSLTDLIGHIKKEYPNYENIASNMRFQLAHTMYNSVWHWLDRNDIDKTSPSVIEALNILTENKFSILQKIHALQIQIVKRTTINNFLSDLFIDDSKSTERDKEFEQIASLFGVDLDSQYIYTYFHSLYQMNDFTLMQNKSLYKALCFELDMQPNEEVLSGKALIYDLTTGAKEEMFKKCITPDIRKTISDQMVKDVTDYESRKNY